MNLGWLFRHLAALLLAAVLSQGAFAQVASHHEPGAVQAEASAALDCARAPCPGDSRQDHDCDNHDGMAPGGCAQSLSCPFVPSETPGVMPPVSRSIPRPTILSDRLAVLSDPAVEQRPPIL